MWVSYFHLAQVAHEHPVTSLPLKFYFTGAHTYRKPPVEIINKMCLGSITINPRLLFQVFGAITVSALALALIFRISTEVLLWQTGGRERGHIRPNGPIEEPNGPL